MRHWFTGFTLSLTHSIFQVLFCESSSLGSIQMPIPQPNFRAYLQDQCFFLLTALSHPHSGRSLTTDHHHNEVRNVEPDGSLFWSHIPSLDLQHRSQIASMKFNEHRDTLLNRHVSLKLRFNFFDFVITPTMLFGPSTCPLTSNQFQQLDVVRNRILDSIVGWAPLVDNDSHVLMQKVNRELKRELENAQQIFNARSI